MSRARPHRYGFVHICPTTQESVRAAVLHRQRQNLPLFVQLTDEVWVSGVLGEHIGHVLPHRYAELGGFRFDDVVDDAIGPGHDLRAVTLVGLALGHNATMPGRRRKKRQHRSACRYRIKPLAGRLLAMGDAAGNDDDGLGLCAALRATALAAASPAAVEWVVTGRWPIPSAPRVEIQWAPIGTEGLGL